MTTGGGGGGAPVLRAETKMRNECRVCGGHEGTTLTTRFRYFRCGRCATLQKVLSEDEYERLNPTYDPGDNLDLQSSDAIREALDVDDKIALLRRVLGNHGRQAEGLSFLDIGCGQGGAMLAARDLGMDVLGFEPSLDHGRVARDLLSLPVETDYFTPDKVAGRRFDLIHLSHVIEHIYRPRPFIEGLVSVLKPGGVLLVVTPNAESLLARALGGRWPMLVPVDHVTLIGPTAVRHLVPGGMAVKTWTSEYPFEFAATVGSVARRWLRGDAPQDAALAATEDADDRSSTARRFSRGGQLAMRAASLPFHIFAKATGRAAALSFTIQRS